MNAIKKFLKRAWLYVPFMVIPILFLLLGNYLLKVFGQLSLRHGDPDYIYLYSGLTMGNLNFDVCHVDNPGTPLQLLVAIVTRITYFFAGKGNYIEDVLSHPDFYLHKVILFNQLIIAFMMFYLTYKLLPVVRNYFMLILLQLSFFTGWSVFYDTTIISPEVLIFVPVSFLVIELVCFLYKPEKEITNLDVLKYALICGFGLSIKLDYFSLFFIPFFILKGWKQFGLYTGVSFLSFVLFAFPIINRHKYFYNWVTGLIMHSGKYGYGDLNFIDLNSFVINVKKIVDFYPFLYFTIGILVVNFLAIKFNIAKPSNTKLKSVLYGILLAAIFQTLLVAKHFGLGYMMPVLYLIPLSLFVCVVSIPSKNYFNYFISFVLILFILVGFYKETQNVLSWKIPQMKNLQKTCTELRKITEHKPLIIIDQPYNFYFKESPLLFGWFFQGKYKPVYKETLLKLYPDVYVYDRGQKKFFLWGDLYSESEIIERKCPIYCFVNASQLDKFNTMFKNIEETTDSICTYTDRCFGNKLYLLSKKKNDLVNP